MSFPPIARVRQVVRQPEVADVPAAVAQAIRSSRIGEPDPAGGYGRLDRREPRIAGIDQIARAAVETLRALGFRPFVVAAMGSHGGGTAEGQRALLAEFGVTEAPLGCPIRSEMDTVVLGTDGFGLPIHFDRNAFGADGIVLLNRIKPHTSFTGRYESGLLKMLTIGLGKRQGAAQVLQARPPRPQADAPGGRRVPAGQDPGRARPRPARERRGTHGPGRRGRAEELLEVEPRLLDESRELMALPELKSGGYDGVTIRQILQMRSGVDYEERYDFGNPGAPPRAITSGRRS